MEHVGPVPDELMIDGEPICHSDRTDCRGRYLVPITRQHDARRHEVLFPFACRVDWIISLVLPGFIFDGFSVPRPLWWFQSPFTGPGFPATADHDPGYWCRWFHDISGDYVARKFWDNRFHRILLHYGETERRSEIMYRSVRIGAGWAWRKRCDATVRTNRDTGLARVYHAGEAEELLTALARYTAIGRLRLEREQHPAKQKIIDQDIVSISEGNIDDVLLQSYFA